MAHPEDENFQPLLFPVGEFLSQDGPDDFFQDAAGGDPWEPIMKDWARLCARAFLQARASADAAEQE